MLRKIQHIGILVEDLERAMSKFKRFGLFCTEVTEIEKVGVRIAFFSIGDTMIEFLHYTGPDKGHPIVRSQKGAINHLCFEVDDLVATTLRKTGQSWLKAFLGRGLTALSPFFILKRRRGS